MKENFSFKSFCEENIEGHSKWQECRIFKKGFIVVLISYGNYGFIFKLMIEKVNGNLLSFS